MKCFGIFVLLVTLSFALAEHIDMEKLKSAKYEVEKEACMQQEKISAQELKQFEGAENKEPSHNLKCFMKCILEKSGAIKDNDIDYDHLKEHITDRLDEEVAKHVMDKCRSLKGSDLCDTAFLLHKCILTV